MKKAVVIVSGGMDSVTLAHLLKNEGYDLHLLSFDYGQRHRKELEFALLCAKDLRVEWHCVDLRDVGVLLKGSALTDDIEVPEGHYAAENMKITVVPNRNAIMLAVAYGVAVADRAQVVATAVHGGDHFVYPDCRPTFLEAFETMQNLAIEGFGDVHLDTPFRNLTKADIVTIGARLGVPFDKTWSCYKGLEYHCGVCGTCVERREAFQLAEIEDPTKYVHSSVS